ncbi:YPDG domain-containing protein [Corynebacterium suedekumii]|nr:YPDG domain-containing protein [Corynebacterium suedekumii]
MDSAAPVNPDGSAVPDGSEFTVDPATTPDGWEVAVNPTTGVVTATAPDDATPGSSVTVPVTATYPDGSTAEVPLTIIVSQPDATQADENTPSYGTENTQPSIPVDVAQTGDTDLPEGTTFATPDGYQPENGWTVEVDETTGVVTVTPPADAPAGTIIEVPVEVTYPDGSVDDTTARVTVGASDAAANNPDYGSESTQPGVLVDVEQTGDTDLPEGTTLRPGGGLHRAGGVGR